MEIIATKINGQYPQRTVHTLENGYRLARTRKGRWLVLRGQKSIGKFNSIGLAMSWIADGCQAPRCTIYRPGL